MKFPVAPDAGIPRASGKQLFPRSAGIAILALLALSLSLGWWRWDSLPSVPGYDEVVINDGAIGILRVGKLLEPGFTGTPLGVTSARQPPGYPLLQAAIFHTFGFTPLSLRISSILPHMAVCILGLLILRGLWERRVLSSRATTVMAILWLSDIAGFWIAREARMEPLEELIGLAAVWVVLNRPRDSRSWWLASLLAGFAFSLHASAILFWIPLMLGFWFFREQLGWRVIAGCAVLPFIVAGALWIATFKGRSWEALALFRTLNSYRNDRGLELGLWVSALSPLLTSPRSFFTVDSLREVMQRGGPAYCVMLTSWILALTRFRRADLSNGWMAFAIACSVGHALCTQFVTDPLAQRIVLMYPFALLALGVSLTSLGPRWERPALVLAALLASVQFAGMFGYAALSGNRSPDRFDSLPLPPGARSVAGTTELWYYFVKRNIPYRLIALAEPCCADYWTLHHEHLDEFDAVILPEGDEMLSWPELVRRPKVAFNDFTGEFVICLRSPATAQPAR